MMPQLVWCFGQTLPCSDGNKPNWMLLALSSKWTISVIGVCVVQPLSQHGHTQRTLSYKQDTTGFGLLKLHRS